MLKQPDGISIFNYCFALGVSEVFFLSSFYLSILDVSLFAIALPFSALFLIFSLYLFLRTHKSVKNLPNQEERRREIHAFYHQSFGIFTIIFSVLLFTALAYIPLLENGGHFYLLYCVPMALLCLIPSIISYKGMKLFKLETDRNLTKI
ncbi:hypothetical protein EI200_03935 [Peribacillus simplex]|uniref:hypothetical protein n=1 Tax=Peribacillus TaxID=2675229 RepID=UPI000B70D240|nr:MULTISPECIES: hypothetical protein [Peribacillus]MDF9759922.1 putative membrane protein YfcA [Peribacillus simplex]MDV7765599.1 hypothetical protein [Peribacillus sp. CSMR9]RRN73847.1 hypothetical protein EI200_03935 [Peribacillus simplex]SNT39741.1 hypothetical protein SAMN05444672_11967 [Bacillus sp. OK838]